MFNIKHKVLESHEMNMNVGSFTPSTIKVILSIIAWIIVIVTIVKKIFSSENIFLWFLEALIVRISKSNIAAPLATNTAPRFIKKPPHFLFYLYCSILKENKQ